MEAGRRAPRAYVTFLRLCSFDVARMGLGSGVQRHRGGSEVRVVGPIYGV